MTSALGGSEVALSAETVTASNTTSKCCGLFKSLLCFRKGFFSNDDEDGSDKSDEIRDTVYIGNVWSRVVLETVVDNDRADRKKRGVFYDSKNDKQN